MPERQDNAGIVLLTARRLLKTPPRHVLLFLAGALLFAAIGLLVLNTGPLGRLFGTAYTDLPIAQPPPAPPSQEPDADSADLAGLLGTLEQLDQTVARLRSRLSDLQTRYDRHTVDSIAMIQQLSSTDPNNPPAAFRRFAQERSDQLSRSDELLETMLDLNHTLQDSLSAADIQPDDYHDTPELDNSLHAPDSLLDRSEQLTRQIGQFRRTLSTTHNKQLWRRYTADLKGRLTRNYQLMLKNTDDRNRLNNALDDADAQRAAVLAQLRLAVEQRPEVLPHGSPQPAPSSVATGAPSPVGPISGPLRSLRYFMVVLFALMGGCLAILAQLAVTSVLKARTAKSPMPIDDPAAVASHPAEPASHSWASQYDGPAEAVVQLRSRFDCPVILLGAQDPKDASPRFAVNLAIALTRRRLRTLLVEADPGGGAFSAIFDLPETPGLSELCRQDASLPDCLQQTRLPLLTVVPVGAATSVEGDALAPAPQSLDGLLDQLKAANDVVLLYDPASLARPAMPSPSPIGDTPSPDWLDLANGAFCMLRRPNRLSCKTRTLSSLLRTRNVVFLGMLS